MVNSAQSQQDRIEYIYNFHRYNYHETGKQPLKILKTLLKQVLFIRDRDIDNITNDTYFGFDCIHDLLTTDSKLIMEAPSEVLNITSKNRLKQFKLDMENGWNLEWYVKCEKMFKMNKHRMGNEYEDQYGGSSESSGSSKSTSFDSTEGKGENNSSKKHGKKVKPTKIQNNFKG